MVIQGNSSKKQKKTELVKLALIEEDDEDVDSPRDGKEYVDVEAENDEVENSTQVEENAVIKGGTTSIRKVASRRQSLVKKLLEGSAVPENLVEVGEEYLQNFLLQTTGKSSSKIFETISKNGKVVKFDKNEIILTRGSPNEHVFIIVEGRVYVLASDNLTTITTLQEGDVFGDVSVLFDVPCTANVKALTETKVIYLYKQDFMTAVDDSSVNADMIDWFVTRRYLPTGDSIDAPRFYRRIAFRILKELRIPLFTSWPDNLIKSLILECDHALLLLYPIQSKLLIEGDPHDSLLIIIDGTVEVTNDGNSVATVVTSNRDAPFVFGESGILLNGQIAAVTISAVTSCKVMKMYREWIMDIVDKHPDLQNIYEKNSLILQQFTSSLGILHKKYEGHLQFDLLFHSILTADYYARKATDIDELWKKIAEGDVHEIEKGEDLLMAREREQYEAVLVVKGMVVVKKNDDTVMQDNAMKRGENQQLAKKSAKSGTDVKRRSLDSAAGIGDADASIDAATDVVEDECKLIGLPIDRKAELFLRAYTTCLVLKIKKKVGVVVRGNSQEADTEPAKLNEDDVPLELV